MFYFELDQLILDKDPFTQGKFPCKLHNDAVMRQVNDEITHVTKLPCNLCLNETLGCSS